MSREISTFLALSDHDAYIYAFLIIIAGGTLTSLFVAVIAAFKANTAAVKSQMKAEEQDKRADRQLNMIQGNSQQVVDLAKSVTPPTQVQVSQMPLPLPVVPALPTLPTISPTSLLGLLGMMSGGLGGLLSPGNGTAGSVGGHVGLGQAGQSLSPETMLASLFTSWMLKQNNQSGQPQPVPQQQQPAAQPTQQVAQPQPQPQQSQQPQQSSSTVTVTTSEGPAPSQTTAANSTERSA